MVVLTATGTLAASAGSDEGQAGGAKTTKQAGPSSGMKAEGRSEAKQHSAMKGEERQTRSNLHVGNESLSKERTRTSSNTRTDVNVRTTHRYAYGSSPDVSIHSRYHRHYVYNEPDSHLTYKRRHHIYSYEEPSVTIRSRHQHIYGETTGGTYVSGHRRGGASISTETTTRKQGGSLKPERSEGKMSKTEENVKGNANGEKSRGRPHGGSAQAGPNKQESGSRQGS